MQVNKSNLNEAADVLNRYLGHGTLDIGVFDGEAIRERSFINSMVMCPIEVRPGNNDIVVPLICDGTPINFRVVPGMVLEDPFGNGTDLQISAINQGGRLFMIDFACIPDSYFLA